MLCGCAGKPEEDPSQQALTFRQDVTQYPCSFQAEITADFGDTVNLFSLSCTHTPDGGTQMRLTAPQTLAGITAQVTDAEGKLVFDGAEAVFGTLEGLGLSPMAAPELLAQAWQSGYISYTGMENGCLHVTYLCGYGEDEYRADVWFENDMPLRAELSCNGFAAVQIEVTDFILRKAETDNENSQKNMGRHLAGQSGT